MMNWTFVARPFRVLLVIGGIVMLLPAIIALSPSLGIEAIWPTGWVAYYQSYRGGLLAGFSLLFGLGTIALATFP